MFMKTPDTSFFMRGCTNRDSDTHHINRFLTRSPRVNKRWQTTPIDYTLFGNFMGTLDPAKTFFRLPWIWGWIQQKHFFKIC